MLLQNLLPFLDLHQKVMALIMQLVILLVALLEATIALLCHTNSFDKLVVKKWRLV